jgi:hypothetical protein
MNIRFVIGAVFATIGLIFFVIAGYIVSRTIDNNHNIETRFAKIEDACQKQLTEILGEKGSIKKLNGGLIEITLPESPDVRTSLGDATAIQAVCPNRIITDACIGVGCTIPASKNPRVILKMKVAS